MIDELSIFDGNIGKFFASLPVDLIGETRMARLQLVAATEHTIRELVEIADALGEPRDNVCSNYFWVTVAIDTVPALSIETLASHDLTTTL